MRRSLGLAALASVACSASSSLPPLPDAGGDVDASVALLGGATTIFDTSANAFTFAARNLSSEHRDAFALGDHFFNRAWVTAPASVSGNDGLGPTFNALSCSACHLRDGRGGTADLLVRLSLPGAGPHGEPIDEPTYGGQLNPRAILGVPAEGHHVVTYAELPGAYSDGEPFSLRNPTYTFADLAFGSLQASALSSPRVAPSMIGLGLLEAVDETTLAALADPDDRDGNGVSGRINRVWDVTEARSRVGRFGWKANQPGLLQQSAGAFLGDIGITTRVFPRENCPKPQALCRAAPSGGTVDAPEFDSKKLDAVVSYARTVAVPARRDIADPTVRRGEALFDKAGCGSCHTARLETGQLPGYPELSGQTIRPYTDLLLHDLGPELADGRPDFEATGSEWRTPPLWGLGLLPRVSKHGELLHDGRARTVAEAILWHGGEARDSRDLFRAMSAADRQALLAFLGSL